MKFVFVLALISFAVAEPWNSRNDPKLFSEDYKYTFSDLPLKGQLSQFPWSDTYWPSFLSGIAHRWYSPTPEDFEYKLYSKDELKTLAVGKLKALSPAEKYDIFIGRYDYPTVKSEWQRTDPRDAHWEGLCHGWAPASLFYRQPSPVTLQNADGISVYFGSSDVKALLTYFAAEYDQATVRTNFVGGRCGYDIEENPKYENVTECADLNAGTFHLILGNQLGLMNQGYIFDRDRSIEVWNQPVTRFNSSVTEKTPIAGGGAQLTLLTTVAYGKETVPAWEAHDPYLVSEDYEYKLQLDATGKIVGGDYISWKRADFQWKSVIGDFGNYFAPLRKIYESSIGNHTTTTLLHNNRIKLAPAFNPEPVAMKLKEKEGVFGIEDYSHNFKTFWSIQPEGIFSEIVISFSQFSTERFRDKVKIYEGKHGEGALVAVLHGEELPQPINVKASGVLIVFSSDEENSAKGFKATYKTL